MTYKTEVMRIKKVVKCAGGGRGFFFMIEPLKSQNLRNEMVEITKRYVWSAYIQ